MSDLVSGYWPCVCDPYFQPMCSHMFVIYFEENTGGVGCYTKVCLKCGQVIHGNMSITFDLEGEEIGY